MEFILQNMQKELEGQVEKVSKCNKERGEFLFILKKI